MKRIYVLCEIDGYEIRYPVYIGRPTPGHHRFHYQAAWLREELRARILDSQVEKDDPAAARNLFASGEN